MTVDLYGQGRPGGSPLPFPFIASRWETACDYGQIFFGFESALAPGFQVFGSALCTW
jgi:hypothetical protein